MPTLAQELGETQHVSALRRRARLLGLVAPEDAVVLAVQRGCHHYAPCVDGRPAVVDPGEAALSHEALTVLLLLGDAPYWPIAIRCAAQLASRCAPAKLAHLARQERVEAVLGAIADAAVRHDPAHADSWRTLVAALSPRRPSRPDRLPHWSRFVSDPGWFRGVRQPVRWLRAE